MQVKLTGCNFNNNGTGVSAEGIDGLAIDKSAFNNNGKDIVVKAHTDSKINISDTEFNNCSTTSISIAEYNHAIEDVDKFAQSSGEFNEKELENFRKILSQLKESKDDSSKFKKCLKEIRSMGESCIPAIMEILYMHFATGSK